jgi:hypothetical protein
MLPSIVFNVLSRALVDSMVKSLIPLPRRAFVADAARRVLRPRPKKIDYDSAFSSRPLPGIS